MPTAEIEDKMPIKTGDFGENRANFTNFWQFLDEKHLTYATIANSTSPKE